MKLFYLLLCVRDLGFWGTVEFVARGSPSEIGFLSRGH